MASDENKTGISSHSEGEASFVSMRNELFGCGGVTLGYQQPLPLAVVPAPVLLHSEVTHLSDGVAPGNTGIYDFRSLLVPYYDEKNQRLSLTLAKTKPKKTITSHMLAEAWNAYNLDVVNEYLQQFVVSPRVLDTWIETPRSKTLLAPLHEAKSELLIDDCGAFLDDFVRRVGWAFWTEKDYNTTPDQAIIPDGWRISLPDLCRAAILDCVKKNCEARALLNKFSWFGEVRPCIVCTNPRMLTGTVDNLHNGYGAAYLCDEFVLTLDDKGTQDELDFPAIPRKNGRVVIWPRTKAAHGECQRSPDFSIAKVIGMLRKREKEVKPWIDLNSGHFWVHWNGNDEHFHVWYSPEVKSWAVNTLERSIQCKMRDVSIFTTMLSGIYALWRCLGTNAMSPGTMRFYRPPEAYNIHNDYLYAEKRDPELRSLLLSALDWYVYMSHNLSLPVDLIVALDYREFDVTKAGGSFSFRDLWEVWQAKRWIIEQDAKLIALLRDGMLGKFKEGCFLINERLREWYPAMIPNSFVFVTQLEDGHARPVEVTVPRYSRDYGVFQDPISLRLTKRDHNSNAKNFQDVVNKVTPYVDKQLLAHLSNSDLGKVCENLGACTRVLI